MTPRRQLDPDESIPGQIPMWDELDAALRGEVRPHGTVRLTHVLPPVLSIGSQWHDGPTILYRAYCRCGVLLYIGVTINLLRRLGTHAAQNAHWAVRVVRWEWETYPRRDFAELAEKTAINTERPVHNRAGVLRPDLVPKSCRCPQLQKTTPGSLPGDDWKDTDE
jgi:predicted GIY-YIG superfamily endonuclease